MNQITQNPFPYSDTNKRYYTLSYYFKQKFGRKVAKIPLDAGFTCPNRDGSKGLGGCSFCSSLGSGDTVLKADQDLQTQFEAGLERVHGKWPDALGIPYFQSFSNTYASLVKLKEIYTPFLENPDCPGIAVATRADCLEDSFLEWLEQYHEKEIWIELGLQSVHDSTMKRMNRQHTTKEVEQSVQAIHAHGLKVCLHLINGLPGETHEMMVESARMAGSWHPDGIKIHMLHIIRNSALGARYQLHPFDLLSQEEYVRTVCDQLEVLPAATVIERLTGDALKEELIAPLWTMRKTAVTNEIDKELVARDSYQSKQLSESFRT